MLESKSACLKHCELAVKWTDRYRTPMLALCCDCTYPNVPSSDFVAGFDNNLHVGYRLGAESTLNP